MKINLLLSLFVLSAATLHAQGDKNLVKNPDFELVTGKLKKAKQIGMAADWSSPTGVPADLYSKTVKELPASAPQNTYGHEMPLSGNNYAGLVFFGYGDKTPRTYITTELTSSLKAGTRYCVKFNVSLADNSKYAVNNIGAHLSKKPFSFDDKRSLMAETHVRQVHNRVYSATYGWEPVCGVFTASGGEKYITIGNFAPTRETRSEKITRPKGNNTPQLPIAYYYVDDVAVFQLDSLPECECERNKLEKAEVIYSEQYASNKEFSLEESITHQTAYFEHLSADINSNAMDNINRLIDLLNENPEAVIEVHAHSDKSETALVARNEEAKEMARKRGESVIRQLEKGGIASDRLMLIVHDDAKPISRSETEVEKAQNRRVDFKLRK